MIIVIAYLIIVNLLSVFVTVGDKRAAAKKQQRIPEKTLMLLAAFGGAPMMYLTMLLIRHKTRKPLFMIGIPAVFLLELLVLFLVLKYVLHLI